MAATFVVYWPAQRNGYVGEDSALVLRDPLIRSWRLIPESFRHFLYIDVRPSDAYRPLQRLTYLADYAAWNTFPRGYHLSSIYLHLGAAVALFLLVEKMLMGTSTELRCRITAFAAAVVWAVHPMQTSAITNIAGRAEPLAALFAFAALGLGLHSLENGKRAWIAALGAGLCLLAALLSKESGLAALLVWWIMLAERRAPRRVLLGWLVASAAILTVYGTLRLSADRTAMPLQESMVWATALLPSTQVLGGALALCGIFGFWLVSKPRPPIFAAIAGAVAAYLLANIGNSEERPLYLPTAFLAIAAAFPCMRFCISKSTIRLLFFATIGVWTAWLGFNTWRQQADWLDERTFLVRAIEKSKASASIRVRMGKLEASERRDDLAVEQFRLSLPAKIAQSLGSLNPTGANSLGGSPLDHSAATAEALVGIASSSLGLRDFQTADTSLDLLQKLGTRPIECLLLRAALLRQRDAANPLPLLEEASAAAPRLWPVQKRYFLTLADRQTPEAAVEKLRAFLSVQPFRADSWKTLGELLSRTRDLDGAARAFEQAIRLDVHDGESRARLAILQRRPR